MIGKRPNSFGRQKSESILRKKERSHGRDGENHDESLEELVTNSDIEEKEFSALGGATIESKKQQSPIVIQSEENQEFLASYYDNITEEAKQNIS